MIIALTALIAPRSRTRRSDAYDRVVDVLGEFVAHGRAHLVIALADMVIRSGKAFQVGDRLNIPNDDVAHT